MTKTRCLLSCVALIAGLANPACSIDKLPGVYRVNVQQGNVVTTEMLQQVELGMEKRKVRYVLGTPLLTDAFHQNRWDYVYSFQPGSGDRVQQRVSLFFEGGNLARIDSDLKPDMDFHTVVDPHDGVIVVEGKSKRGFFAALVPGFMKRDRLKKKETDASAEAADAQDGIETTDETVSTAAVAPATSAPQSPDTAAVVGAAVGAPAVADDLPGDDVSLEEIYAPNENAETARADQTESEFLEALFEDFGESYEGAVKRNRKEQTEAQAGTTTRD